MPICPISAAGDLWAPGFVNYFGPTSLVMLRLDKESEQWLPVATMEAKHCVIHGYVVVRDTILLSLEPQHLFVVFDCRNCAWTAVKTNNNCSTYACTFGKYITDYVPIRRRGLYIEEDDTIYFLRDNVIYAYKLCKDQDQCQYRMALPTVIDRVSPFGDEEGSGFLTHLSGQVMCFVWICKLHCSCDSSHVLITTFQVIGDSGSNREHFIPKGVQVLHSTYRRLEKSVMQTVKDLYIICQAPRYSTVFKINIMDGRLACHNQNLMPYGVMDTFVCDDPDDDLMEQPFPWHFVCDSTSIYAVRDKINDIHIRSLAKGTHDRFEARRPFGIDFSIALVLTVGIDVIALSDTLGGVYHLSDTHEWEHHSIQGFVDLKKKVKLSGYVVLNDKSFMVCDAETSCCFLFDLGNDKWSIVRAHSDVSDGGLEACEIIKVQDSYYLGEKICLRFEWLKYWDRKRMCLDYVGQETTSGAVMFCVVQGILTIIFARVFRTSILH
ncbi:hypothetical protein HU200_063861 [Digitaria exilis]|uniref:Uncharacterized protein n=1 Tax=Digitaria exilis TaxID=1010633 RepID=A0A835A2V0_9POAL|nr:hypothetical protein HU200_063861 [Digitaria exilis]